MSATISRIVVDNAAHAASMSPMKQSTPSYFETVDVLRGFAALSVVIYH
jgi:hypothetical protein